MPLRLRAKRLHPSNKEEAWPLNLKLRDISLRCHVYTFESDKNSQFGERAIGRENAIRGMQNLPSLQRKGIGE